MSDSSWCPKSSLDRFLETAGLKDRQRTISSLQENFRQALLHTEMEFPEEDDSFWASAQHVGLPTPFLDWSRSPWIALYFAASGISPHPASQNGVVLRLAIDGMPTSSSDLRTVLPSGRAGSRRLLAQDGLFTEAIRGDCILEALISLGEIARLTAFVFPMTLAGELLRVVHSMNIRDIVLFPDLTGAIREAIAVTVRG